LPMRRKPAVAGSFYPGSAAGLRKMIGEMIDARAVKVKAKAVICPHAGYMYSGSVAGAVYASVEIPDICVVLCPSHQGIRPMFALMSEGSWETPLGDIPISSNLAKALQKHSALLEEDASAHSGEHSLEVQLPFLQYLRPSVSLVPICVSHLAAYRDLEELGRAVAAGIKETRSEALVVASTDMSHYISQERAKKKDFLAIGRILDLDPQGLFETVRREDITMCGFQPTAAALVAAKELGASKAELIKYQTSGDVTGDLSAVVGYAGIRII
jgi:AmmeMemoRadiSam system protein B